MKGTLISEFTQKHKNIYFFSLWIFTWLKIIFTPSIIFITLKDAFKRNCYVDKHSEEIYQYCPIFLCSLLFTPCIRSFSHALHNIFPTELWPYSVHGRGNTYLRGNYSALCFWLILCVVSAYYSNLPRQAEVVSFREVFLYCSTPCFWGASETLFCFLGPPMRVVMVTVLFLSCRWEVEARKSCR